MAAQRYYLQVEDISSARGANPGMSFEGSAGPAFSAALGAALREPALFQRWRAQQEDPDAVDASLGALDPDAKVEVKPARTGHGGDVVVTTSLPHAVMSHRLGLLIGRNWTLRDVKSA